MKFFPVFVYALCVSCTAEMDTNQQDLISKSSEPSASVESKDNGGYQVRFGVIEPTEDDMDVEKDDENTPKILKFTYQGVAYESVYSFDSDRNMIVADEKVSKLVDLVKQIPTLSTIVYLDGSLHFFDTHAEQVSYLKKNSNKETAIATKATGPLYIRNVTLRLWQRAKGRTKGGVFFDIFSYDNGAISPPALNWADLRGLRHPLDPAFTANDMTSSMEMWAETDNSGWLLGLRPGQYTNAVVTFYENPNFGGRSLVFPEVTVNYTYTRRDYFESFNFDNIASSLKIIYQ
jgi:hypothetical protein